MINIIIPCYNESENINNIIKKIKIQNIGFCKIYIIDDSTKSFKKKISKSFKNIIYIHRKKKLGRGSAVLCGLDKAIDIKRKNDIFIEMDADLSHDPFEIKDNILYFYKNKLDLLISSRYLKKSKIINWTYKRKILSFFSNLLAKYLLRVPVSDYTNGYRIYSYKAARHITLNCGKIGDGFIVLSEILVSLNNSNFKIGETHCKFINRVRGESNVTVSELLQSIIGLLKIYRNYKLK